MLFHSNLHKVEDLEIFIVKTDEADDNKTNGTYITERTFETEHLGLIVEENLNWVVHVKHVEAKIANASGVLLKLRKSLPLIARKLSRR